MGTYELRVAGAGVAGADPDLFLAVDTGFLLEAGLVAQQSVVHLQDGILGDLVREREGCLHGADVPDDGERVGLVAFIDLGESELLRRRRQLLDL